MMILKFHEQSVFFLACFYLLEQEKKQPVKKTKIF